MLDKPPARSNLYMRKEEIYAADIAYKFRLKQKHPCVCTGVVI